MHLAYFAYGSNMFARRLRVRVPNAHFIAVACLRGYLLRFHKRSRDGSAKCNIVSANAADEVYGVLFHVPAAEKSRLDAAEGVGNGYHEEVVSVELHGGHRVDALAYVADTAAVDDTLVPYTWYHKHVVAGALEHRLPESYVRALAAVVTAEDPDEKRRTPEEALHESAG